MEMKTSVSQMRTKETSVQRTMVTILQQKKTGIHGTISSPHNSPSANGGTFKFLIDSSPVSYGKAL